MPTMQTRLIVVGLIDAALLLLAHAFRGLLDLDNSIVAWAIAAVGLTTLFGLLSGSSSNTTVSTRFAIAVTVVVVWVVAVGNLLFFTGDTRGLAEEAFDSITIAMSVVIAFYFGAQAYQAVAGAKAKGGEETEGLPEDASQKEVYD